MVVENSKKKIKKSSKKVLISAYFFVIIGVRSKNKASTKRKEMYGNKNISRNQPKV